MSSLNRVVGGSRPDRCLVSPVVTHTEAPKRRDAAPVGPGSVAMLGLVLVLAVVATVVIWSATARAQTATDTGTGTTTAGTTGEVQADLVDVRDNNALDRPNKVTLRPNDTNITGSSSCVDAGVSGRLTLIDADESSADDWVICEGNDPLTSLSTGRPLAGGPLTIITANQTLYLQVGGSDVSGAVAEVATRMPPVRLKRLRATLSAPPGTGESVVLTLQKGTCGTALSDTALAATVSGSNVTADDLVDTIALSPGECVAMKVTYSSGAAASFPRHSIEAL